MNKVVRPYQSGDEKSINTLYKLITHRDRSKNEYLWEWVNTWHGMGSIWLVFDSDRSAQDQLIAQYSLIPTPVSAWGKSYLCGKTENCMSHPVIRGSGVYFYHERRCFEEAKKIYQIFFTTSGHVAKGAPGAIRQKLGYIPFDSWVSYIFWVDASVIRTLINKKLSDETEKSSFWSRFIAVSVAKIVAFYSFWFRSMLGSKPIEILSESQAPLDDLESLWNSNRQLYGVSVDRTRQYMEWRINQNPYVKHQYLVYRKDDRLKGYLIFTQNKDTIDVVDILADEKRREIFKTLLNGLKKFAIIEKVVQIRFSTLKRNKFLARLLRANGFIPNNIFSLKDYRNSFRRNQFYVYLPRYLKKDPRLIRNENWFITDLVKEGRPYQ